MASPKVKAISWIAEQPPSRMLYPEMLTGFQRGM